MTASDPKRTFDETNELEAALIRQVAGLASYYVCPAPDMGLWGWLSSPGEPISQETALLRSQKSARNARNVLARTKKLAMDIESSFLTMWVIPPWIAALHVDLRQPQSSIAAQHPAGVSTSTYVCFWPKRTCYAPMRCS